MNAHPNVSQGDRSAIEDRGLPDVDEHLSVEEPKLLHHDERTPT